MVVKICVIGAGIVGISSAIQIAESFRDLVKVTILTDNTSPNTTGDGSAGIWTPYFIIGPKDDKRKLHKWGSIAFQEWLRIWKNGQSEDSGICLMPIIHLSDKSETMDSFCHDIVFGWKALNREELSSFSAEYGKTYKSGSQSVSFVCEVRRMIPFLMKRFKSAGGDIMCQHVNSFDEISNDFDVIINCTGVGALHLINDPHLYPVRGQSMRIEAPWLYHVIIDSTRMNQIAPNIDSVFIGGTAQYGNSNRGIDPVDSAHIRDGCIELNKSIANAKLLWEWVGLRPGRDFVRLEMENFISNKNKKLKIIHNYGHGGSGVTLSWGCGAEIVEMLQNVFKENGILSVKSKI